MNKITHSTTNLKGLKFDEIMVLIGMAKKTLKSGLELTGIAPNRLIQAVENTAPFIFTGEIKTDGKKRQFLEKLKFYKKNLKQLKNIDLTEYFYLCMAAHWSTAGTFVPTDVDNQIREGLWKRKEIQAHIEKMARITIDSWSWDYEQVTNRKSYNQAKQVLSTHEGTWLSVAIGAYCALTKNRKPSLAEEVQSVILQEIEKEEQLLLELREKRDHINFLRSTALMAHNFGDLDRVMDQWGMKEDSFHKRIYKLGHKENPHYSKVLAYSGQVNKHFMALENHRHMSMRAPKALRRSHEFLISVGPFMDEWGKKLGQSEKLSLPEKGEIINAFFEGYTRQDKANGYIRAFKGFVDSLPNGLLELEEFMASDLVTSLKESPLYEKSKISQEEFNNFYASQLDAFKCPLTELNF